MELLGASLEQLVCTAMQLAFRGFTEDWCQLRGMAGGKLGRAETGSGERSAGFFLAKKYNSHPFQEVRSLHVSLRSILSWLVKPHQADPY